MYIVTTVVEVGDSAELEKVTDRMAQAICGDAHAAPDRPCPTRWFMASHPADAGEIAEWSVLLDDPAAH